MRTSANLFPPYLSNLAANDLLACRNNLDLVSRSQTLANIKSFLD